MTDQGGLDAGRDSGPSRGAPKGWPASSAEIRPLAGLRLNPDNPRKHSLEQIEQISNSMRRWGWAIPVLIDESGLILAGHGRVRAARLMGWTEASCVIARGWSEDEKRAYMIADNEIAARSDWDPKLLRGELKKLVAKDFDVSLIGFSTEDLAKLMVDPGSKEGETPEQFTVTVCPTCGSAKRDRKT